MKNLIGSFYFELTTSGNLIGEFTNDKSDEILAETAFAQGAPTAFVGTFKSTWFDTALRSADLEITPDPKNNKLYKLEWMENTTNAIYVGKGFLHNNSLMGYYKKVK